jgi:hypothetical protein
MTNIEHHATGLAPAGCPASARRHRATSNVAGSFRSITLRPGSRPSGTGPAPCPDPPSRADRRSPQRPERPSDAMNVSVPDGRLVPGQRAPRIESKSPALPGRALVARTVTIRTKVNPNRITVRADMQTPRRSGSEVKEMASRNTRQTGTEAAKAASKVLSNPKSSKAAKSAAASALSQTPKRK